MAQNSNGDTQRSPRPESTIAMDFSSALDGAFNLSGELPELQQNVEQKKMSVTSQSQELQELEARLRATEERLRKAGMEAGTTSTASGQREQTQSAPPRATAQAAQTSMPTSPIRQVPPSSRRGPQGSSNPAVRAAAAASSITDRAPTPMDPSRSNAMPGAMPGALPETPGSMKDGEDYYSSRRG